MSEPVSIMKRAEKDAESVVICIAVNGLPTLCRTHEGSCPATELILTASEWLDSVRLDALTFSKCPILPHLLHLLSFAGHPFDDATCFSDPQR